MVSHANFDSARERAVGLAERTSLGVGGRPEFFFEPESAAEVAQIVSALAERGLPLRVLGGGYNLLVGDEPLEGAVLATRFLRGIRVHADRVEVGAGHSFPDLVRRSVDLSIPALPGCPGIPGNVGGVVAMNAGGRFGTVADALLAVEGVDAEGAPFLREVSARDFGYRTSPFAGAVITGAWFRRDLSLNAQDARERCAQAWAWKRQTQPLKERSAGCIFKNPSEAGGGRSAGRLIDEAGLKGLRVGDAEVSALHANFIVNRGQARAQDVLELIERVQALVEQRHGVRLELEVRRW